jgi:hypothetical protein
MSELNVKFEYLYRDAGNYKVYGHVIFSNQEKLTKLEIKERLKSFEFFNPKDLKIPRLRHADLPYDTDLDHSWNEYSTVEETNDSPTDKRSISEFLNELLSLKG